MLTTHQVFCASMCVCVRVCACYLVDGRAWLACTRGRMGLRDTDWLHSLVGCGQNMNDCYCLSRCRVLGTVTEEGWGVCACRGESIRACEGREARKRGREKENRSLWEREGGRELQAAGPDYRSNTAVFLFASLRKLSFSSLPVRLSFLFLLSLLGHDPGGHLDLLAHLEKRIEML